MKLLLLVALATVVTATSLFKPGEEYVYHYKGHVLTGIPKVSKQFGGVLIDSIVTFQFQQDYKVVMKLDKIKLFKINNQISTHPEEPLREEEIQLLTGEQTHVLTEYLIKPIKFRYTEGEVEEVEKESTDRYWSVNIKKGILSLFQVNLKDRTSSSPNQDPFSSFNPYETREQRLKQTPYGQYQSRNPNTLMTPQWRSNKNSVYRVMETDVTGTCETKYSLTTDKTRITSTMTEMHVTTVRDFKTCTTEPFYIQGLFQGVYNEPEEAPLFEPMVHKNYVIVGDRSNFLIKEAKLRGKYSFRIHGLDGGSVTSFIHQTLTLKTTQPIRRPKMLSGPVPERNGLHMVIPKASQIPEKQGYEEPVSRRQSNWNRRNEYSSPLRDFPTPPRDTRDFLSSRDSRDYLSQRDSRDYLSPRDYFREDEEEEEEFRHEVHGSILSVVEDKLNKLVDCVYGHETETTGTICSTIIYQISKILRELPHSHLKNIVSKYVKTTTSNEVEYRKSEVLLDLLPTMISPASSKVLIELIKERRVSELRGSLMINAMCVVAKPTPSVITSLLELHRELPREKTSTPKLMSKNLLRQGALLGVGTLTHRMITVMRNHRKTVPEVLNFIETITGEFKKMYSEASTVVEKKQILSAMINMGAHQLIPTIKSVIENPAEHTEVRHEAIFALRHLARQHRTQVLPILLSIFMDVNEEHRLRQSAFLVIMHSKPGFTTLQMIGHRLRHEPSHQLRTLVYSSLVNLAMHTSHVPEYKEIKKNAMLVVKSIPPVLIGPYDSFSMKLSKFNEEYDMGASISVTKTKSKHSGLLEGLMWNLKGTYLGRHRHILETGVVGSSLEKVIRKVFGPYGMLSEFMKGKVTLEDFTRPIRNFDWNNLEYKVKEVLGKTWSDMGPEERPNTYFYLYFLDHKIQEILLTSETSEEIIDKASVIIPEIISKLTRGIKVDVIKSMSLLNSLTIASPIGIPLTVNSTLLGVGKVDGFIKVHNLPTVTELFRRSTPFTAPKISLDVDLKPKFEVVHWLSVGCNMRWITTGVYLEQVVKSNHPVKLNVQFKGPEHEISIRSFVPKQPTTLLHAKMAPYTFMTFTPTTVDRLPYTFEEKEISNNKIVQVLPIEHKYKCMTTGGVVETKGVISVCGPNWCPTAPLFGKQSITVKHIPQSPVEYVHLKIKSLRSNIEMEGIPANRPTEELYGYDVEDEFESEFYSEKLNPKHFRKSNSMMMVTSGEFDPVRTDETFSTEPIKRQILVTIGPSTYQSPKVKALFTWLMSRRYWKNQFNLQVVRLSHEETPAWKIHLNTVVNPQSIITHMGHLPTHTYTTSEMNPTSEHLLKTRLSWTYGPESNEIRMKLTPGSPIDFSRELSENKIITAFSLPEARSQKYKFTLETEVNHMTRNILRVINLGHNSLVHRLYDYTTTSVSSTPTTNKVLVAFEVLPLWETMNVIVKTPLHNSYITKVPLYWNPLLPTNERIRMHDLPSWSWYKNFTYETDYEPRQEDWDWEPFDTVPYRPSPVVSGECSLEKHGEDTTLRSFDGAVRSVRSLGKYHKSGCWTVVTKHCQNERLFNIRSLHTGRDTRKMKVTVQNNEIEVQGEPGRITVLVNGMEKTISPSRPLVITEDYTETGSRPIKIEKLDSDRLEINIFELGARLNFDNERRSFKVKLTPWSTLQGELCGMCGNFNLDQSDDYTMGEILNTPDRRPNFFESSVLPSDTCNFENLWNTEDDYCMTEKPLTMRRFESDDVPMTCRSDRAIRQCTRGCRPVETESVKTCFTCTTESGMSLPQKTYYTPRWEDESGVECSGFYQRIEVPTRCVPVY